MATFRRLWMAAIIGSDASSEDRARLNPMIIIESDELGQNDMPLFTIQVIQGVPPNVIQIHDLEYRGPRTHARTTEEVELTGFDFAVFSSISITRGDLVWKLRFDNGTADYVLRMSLVRANPTTNPSIATFDTDGRWRTSG